MAQGKMIIVVLVTLVVGFVAGFALRPVVSPTPPIVANATQGLPAIALPLARGTQYFLAHIDEARRIAAQCRSGSVRGDECANAGAAIVTADAQARFKRFTGN